MRDCLSVRRRERSLISARSTGLDRQLGTVPTSTRFFIQGERILSSLRRLFGRRLQLLDRRQSEDSARPRRDHGKVVFWLVKVQATAAAAARPLRSGLRGAAWANSTCGGVKCPKPVGERPFDRSWPSSAMGREPPVIGTHRLTSYMCASELA
jgi:hypothetical protein